MKQEVKYRVIKEHLDDICAHDVVAFLGTSVIAHPFEKRTKTMHYLCCVRCDQSIVVDYKRSPYTAGKSTVNLHGNIYPIWQKPSLRYNEND